MIKDSGSRESFKSGAVRDMNRGKGRCDLLPLSVISKIILCESKVEVDILSDIEKFQRTGDIEVLLRVANSFIDEVYNGDKIKAILELSIHYEEGARKYSEWNWTKGIELWSFVSSAVRHYLKVKGGWKDESHERAFLWNIVGAIWTVANRKDLVEVLDFNEGYQPFVNSLMKEVWV